MDDFWCLFIGAYCCLSDCDGEDQTDGKRGIKATRSNRRVTPVSYASKPTKSKAEDEQRLLSASDFVEDYEDNTDDDSEERASQNRTCYDDIHDTLLNTLWWNDIACLSLLLFGPADEMDENIEDVPAIVQVEKSDDADCFCSDSISDISDNRHGKSCSNRTSSYDLKCDNRHGKTNLSEAVNIWIADSYPGVTNSSSRRSKSKRSPLVVPLSLTLHDQTNSNSLTTMNDAENKEQGYFENSSSVKHRLESGNKTKETGLNVDGSILIVRAVSSSYRSEPPKNKSSYRRKTRSDEAKRTSSFSVTKCFDPFESEIALSPKTVCFCDFETHDIISPPSIIVINKSSSKDLRYKKNNKSRHK